MAEQPDPAPGTLLIAAPTLEDPNFRRRVVLLCEHSDQGSVGLVLNNPTDISLGSIVEEVPALEREVFVGGPVQQNILHVLHRHGDLVDGSLSVVDDLSWGGKIDTIQELIDLGYTRPKDLRFFLGYSGWGPHQLENEIEAGGWILTRTTPERLFVIDPEELWRELLLEMGGRYAMLYNYPEDPRMN
jgi:putative transcriptional regulator